MNGGVTYSLYFLYRMIDLQVTTQINVVEGINGNLKWWRRGG